MAFIRNSATLGGGLENETSNQTLMNVSFRGNHSFENVGRVYELSSTSSLVNVTFYGNTAPGSGGGMLSTTAPATLQNAVLWGDQAEVLVRKSTITVTFRLLTAMFRAAGDERVEMPSAGPTAAAISTSIRCL